MGSKTIIHNVDPGPWGKPKGSGGSSGNGGGGWQPGNRTPKGGPQGGDMEDLLRDIKQHLHTMFGGQNNNRGLVAAFVVFILLWLASGIYQLQPGEQGVVMRFGKFDRIATSGLRYHLPTPFESVNIVNSEAIRMETLGGDNVSSRNTSMASGDDGILMLTGDENIINLSFNVQWKVRDAKAFVFNIPDPEETVRAVTESAMREIIGRTTIESALTEGKSKVQEDTRKLTQDTLDNYKAGIQILQVNLLDASFPQAVVDAARDVQAARADRERARNEAEAYRNDILPRARGQATRTIQEAEAYKQEVVAKAEGDAARFISVYTQYKQAQDVTRKRIYMETMEKILAGTNKIILDTKSGVVPYLPLPEVKNHASDKKRGAPMTTRLTPIFIIAIIIVLILFYNVFYIVTQTETALVTQFGNPVAVETDPGLKLKIPFIQTIEYFDKRLLEYDMSDEIEINASDEKRIRLEAFVRWRIIDPLAFARATRTAGIGGNRVSTMNMQLSNLLGSSLRQVIGSVPLNALLSPERDHVMREILTLMDKQASSSGEPDSDTDNKTLQTPKTKSGFGIEIVDVRIVKADLPKENSDAIFRRMQTERAREAKSYRAKGDEDAQGIKAGADRERTVLLAEAQKQSEILRGEGDATASKIFADAFGKDPEFFEFYRAMQAYGRAINAKDTTVILSPDSEFLKEFSKTK